MKKSGIVLIFVISGICAIIAAGLVWIYWADPAGIMKVRYEQRFANRLAEVMEVGAEVPLSALAECQWDEVFVFGPYATRKQKFEAAGYEYASGISDNVREGTISLLFLKSGEVVYYVDSLFSDKYDLFEALGVNWAFFTNVEHALFKDEPIISVSQNEYGIYILTLDIPAQ